MSDMSQYDDTIELLSEQIAALELALEDVSWTRLAAQTDMEFSREGLRRICELAHIFYLKNPLIKRAVNVQADYVFGQGITIQAEDTTVDRAVRDFIDDSKNRAELTRQQAQLEKEIELAISGNLFFVFFTNPATGRVRVRTIPVAEIEEIICNPEDAKDPWFYKRVWNEIRFDAESGTSGNVTRTAYYPDWHYAPEEKPGTIGGQPVQWDSPVYHVKVGGLADMRFGVPEVYAGLDWAKAYVEFLEDWATLTRAYSRFAWQLTTKGGKRGIAAARAKLGSTAGMVSGETNPPPVTGSIFVGDESTSMTPIKTSGATVSAEDGRRLMLMVAATVGLPESFFGDVSVGTLATAKSLDRPTELKFRSRQTLWGDVFKEILDFVILKAVKAGTLEGTIIPEDDGTPRVELEIPGQGRKSASSVVRVEFPPILEHDVAASVNAIVSAATLGGMEPAGTIDERTVSRMLLQALGADEVENLLNIIYPADDEGDSGEGEPEETEAAVMEAVRALREALKDVAHA